MSLPTAARYGTYKTYSDINVTNVYAQGIKVAYGIATRSLVIGTPGDPRPSDFTINGITITQENWETVATSQPIDPGSMPSFSGNIYGIGQGSTGPYANSTMIINPETVGIKLYAPGAVGNGSTTIVGTELFSLDPATGDIVTQGDVTFASATGTSITSTNLAFTTATGTNLTSTNLAFTTATGSRINLTDVTPGTSGIFFTTPLGGTIFRVSSTDLQYPGAAIFSTVNAGINTILLNSTGTSNINGVVNITGSGFLNYSATGTLGMSGAVSLTGTLSVTGTLNTNGNVNMTGGTITVNGTLNATGTGNINLLQGDGVTSGIIKSVNMEPQFIYNKNPCGVHFVYGDGNNAPLPISTSSTGVNIGGILGGSYNVLPSFTYHCALNLLESSFSITQNSTGLTCSSGGMNQRYWVFDINATLTNTLISPSVNCVFNYTFYNNGSPIRTIPKRLVGGDFGILDDYDVSFNFIYFGSLTNAYFQFIPDPANVVTGQYNLHAFRATLLA